MHSGRDIAIFAAQTALEKKGENIVVYDVRGIYDISDYLVVVTAHSRAQIRAIIESVKRDLKAHGTRKIGQEGDEGGQWVLLDYSDCVIHIFTPALRDYYNLESMWGDAPKIAWEAEPPMVLGEPVAAASAV